MIQFAVVKNNMQHVRSFIITYPFDQPACAFVAFADFVARLAPMHAAKVLRNIDAPFVGFAPSAIFLEGFCQHP